MTTMRHRMQEALNRLPAMDPIEMRVGVGDRANGVMMMGAREALRYFLLGTSDAPPELLQALQGTTESLWTPEELARQERVAENAAPVEPPSAPVQHAEIWYLWTGKLTELKAPGARYIIGAGLALTDTDTTMRMQIYEVLRRAAVCGLTYENNAWKPVALRDELCDFLLPNGLCVHMRCERAEVVADVAAEVRDTLPRIALAAPAKLSEQAVSLTLADLEALLVSRGG